VTISIRQRLTLWYTAAVSILLGTIAVSLMLVHSRLTLTRLDTELQRVNATVSFVFQDELHEGLAPKAAAEDCLSEAILTARHVAIFTRDGALLAKRWSLPGDPPFDPPEAAVRVHTVSTPVRYRLVSVSEPPVPAGYVVVTAASWDELTEDRQTIARALVLVIPIALVIAAVGAWWVAGRALRPASAMAEQARQITDQSTKARLTVARDDELGQLATAFNELLDRLETALDVRRQFLADASHELRTPVSIARTAADVALSRDVRTETEYRDALAVVGEQMTRLGRMVADMLALARTDVADWPLSLQDFYFDELVADVARDAHRLADDGGVAIETACPTDLQCRGDEALLRQLLMNLVENAVRHTPRGGVVHVEATTGSSGIAVRVCDTGTGIADVDRERIFDRFVRIDPSGHDGGLGLGLAIARRIARAHRGELALETTNSSGTTFLVTLPFQPPAVTEANVTVRSTV
jgi:heavy metal sensor kinase